MNALYMILAAICVLGPLVALHEFGHYIVARWCGVQVQVYSIGFGPRLFSWQSRRSGIRYQIAAIPLGGYVKMLDERNEKVAEQSRHKAFNNQHPLKKIAIVAAGPVMNLLIAVALFWLVFLFPSEELNTRIGKILPNSPAASSALMVDDQIISINNKPTQTWQQAAYALADVMGETTKVAVEIRRDNATTMQVAVPVVDFLQGNLETKQPKDPLSGFGVLPYQVKIEPVIDEVLPDGAGAMMGLQAGDRFVSIDGVMVDDWLAAAQIIQDSPGKMLNVVIMRQGKEQVLKLMPRTVKTKHGKVGQLGIKPKIGDELIPQKYRITIENTPSQAFDQAIKRTYDLSTMTLSAIAKMITGLIGIENLSGPISIAEVSKTSFELGLKEVLSTAAIISLSLAVLNLLPIPVLDGGHLLFYTYELIVGKPMSETLQAVAFRLGALLLLCFMLLAISNDIMRLFG
ncbi:RIP metalloprotease RseP [Moraxella cuniculi]|uniref:Zinc metalloprotease n=1 Tax=Moraxella cuniculi TaxID=34061 RepID=A0A448GWI1_9GAMM|nr:RIP metalloprotease RseP [Moraxella cuniculi]VEG13132.1 Regulator of sigma E protease [Moraxella cuniculi]